MRGPSTPVQRAEKLASQQHAAINRRQALGCGVTARQIRRILASGRWVAHTCDVFLMAGSPSTWQQRAALAWLAGPPTAVISHGTAAALHGLGRPPSVPHITVPHGCSGRIKGAVVHRTRTPAGAADRRWIGGLLCTDVARTIGDCAEVLTYDELCDLLDNAVCERKTRPAAVAASAARAAKSKGKKGQRQLHEALAIWTPGPVADAATEMRLARRLQQWGCPPLERQVKIRDHRGKVVAKGDLGIAALKPCSSTTARRATVPGIGRRTTLATPPSSSSAARCSASPATTCCRPRPASATRSRRSSRRSGRRFSEVGALTLSSGGGERAHLKPLQRVCSIRASCCKRTLPPCGWDRRAVGGRAKVAWDLTIRDGKIVHIDMLAAPESLDGLDLTILDD